MEGLFCFLSLGTSSTFSGAVVDQTRYRPRIYRWFPENVKIIEFYWLSQGAALISASAEAYSVLDDAHQRHADLVLAVEHIEQQYHALLAVHGHEDGVQLGKAAFGNAYAIPRFEGRSSRCCRALLQVIDQAVVEPQRYAAETHDANDPTSRAQGCPVGIGCQLDEQITGEQRFGDDLPTATHYPLAAVLRPIAGIALAQQVFFCALILAGLAMHEVPGRGRTCDAGGSCGTYIHMGIKQIGAASADRQFTPVCSWLGWAGRRICSDLASR